MFRGDFNEVLAMSEVMEGGKWCTVAMMGFNDVLNRYFLHDKGLLDPFSCGGINYQMETAF